MGTHLRELAESYPMNTNMTGFRWFSKIFAFLCFGRKVASALEGLNGFVPARHGGLRWWGTFSQVSRLTAWLADTWDLPCTISPNCLINLASCILQGWPAEDWTFITGPDWPVVKSRGHTETSIGLDKSVQMLHHLAQSHLTVSTYPAASCMASWGLSLITGPDWPVVKPRRPTVVLGKSVQMLHHLAQSHLTVLIYPGASCMASWGLSLITGPDWPVVKSRGHTLALVWINQFRCYNTLHNIT